MKTTIDTKNKIACTAVKETDKVSDALFHTRRDDFALNGRLKISGQTFSQERALYNIGNALVENCVFAGEADGESALKECSDIFLSQCEFHLRYPVWHAQDFVVENCTFFETARAAMWYCRNGKVFDSNLLGIKALRECEDVTVEDCNVFSPEFCWKCRNLTLTDCKVQSEYFLLDCKNVSVKNLSLKGKYSFQYLQGGVVEDCLLDTKDAFWHAKDVVVRNCDVKGEYLGWYAENLTFENCRISGTQPLCYCKNLKLINCTMEDCDLAFEYSDVQAKIVGSVQSVKNPLSGRIVADNFEKIIWEDSAKICHCNVIVKK